MQIRKRWTMIRAAAGFPAVLVIIGVCAWLRAGAFDLRDLRDAIDRQIHRSTAELFNVQGPRVPPPQMNPKLVRLYHERDMQPYWVTAEGPNRNAGILRSILAAADTQGLNPGDYAIDQIERVWDRKDAESLARLELLLTMELGAYGSDLVEGRHQPQDFDPKLFPTACDCELDPAALIEKAFAAPDLKVFLEDQAPPFLHYRGLRDKLAEYRAIAARGGWPQVPSGPTLKPGARDPRVPAVRKHLSVTGEWPVDDPLEGTEYDRALTAAIKRFQRHHGLDPDGVVGRATLAAMNVSVVERIRQIIISMETWRWVARDPGDWWLMINIPSFRLVAMRGGKTELSMSVIVGDEYHMTPVFSDRLRYIEINPYWNVPLSIAQKEMLPKLREDPSYLKKGRIRMFDGGDGGLSEIDSAAVDWTGVGPDDMGRYRLRQDSGPDNSLGTVAFIFPNPFDVYLHDTPALGLFQVRKRTFSHGCIRVYRAQELAAYVLGGPDAGWTEERVGSLIAEGKNQIVHLEPSLPIYILYNTAVVDPESHELYFYPDVYSRDVLLGKAIF
jgi:murein L,D-transpeptidase YcbB/YkuD